MTTDTQLAPTDAEIESLAARTLPIHSRYWGDTNAFARAVLARWGQPAHSGEPYGCVTTHRGTGQQFFYRYPAPPYLDNASECVTVYTAPQPVEREPLSDEIVDSLCKVGPVYAPDGKVTRTPAQYRDELEAAQRYGLRKGERAHGIKGGQHGAE